MNNNELRGRAELVRLRATKRYQRLRLRFMRRNPLCAWCSDAGKTVASEEVDHIVPAVYGHIGFLDRSNWQALCRACHIEKTRNDVANMPRSRYLGCSLDGTPRAPR